MHSPEPILVDNPLIEANSLKKINKKNKLKKIEKNEIGDVAWEYLNIEKYVEKIKNDRLLIYGVSGEGKSFFAAQLIICKIISNMKNNITTIFEATSQSKDAEILTVNLAEFFLNMFPDLKPIWNTETCPLQLCHTGSLENMAAQMENFKLMQKKDLLNVEKIWYFDDIGTILTKKTKIVNDFFDDLCSRGRHYNITSIFCTQKLDIAKPILNSSNNICFVGNLASNVWETFKKKCSFHLGSANDNFYKNYSNRIGLTKSRNILVVDKSSQCVYLHKVPQEFVTYWEPMMKKEID
jgi:hypothetical protein